MMIRFLMYVQETVDFIINKGELYFDIYKTSNITNYTNIHVGF